MLRLSGVVLLAATASVSAVLCPNGHSDCPTGQYCSNFPANQPQECWPCAFCAFYPSVTGDCSLCSITTSAPVSSAPTLVGVTLAPVPGEVAPPTSQPSSGAPSAPTTAAPVPGESTTPPVPGESPAPTTSITGSPVSGVTAAPVPGESSTPPTTAAPVATAAPVPGESSTPPTTAAPVATAAPVPGESSSPTASTTTAAPVPGESSPTAGPVTSAPVATPAPTAAVTCDVTVTTQGITFIPNSINIVVGQTVCWTPSSAHNVQQIADPNSCVNMSSPMFVGELGEAVQHTFTAAGTFHFKCLPHCDIGMRGVVTVADAPSTTQPPSAAPTPLVCQRNCGQPENGGGTCNVRQSDGAVRCTSCNADRVLLKGRCNVEINCIGNVIQSGRLASQSCRCLDNDCYSCIREPTRDVCRRCRSNKYLHNDACHDGCPPELTHSGVGAFKRRCTYPHVCQSGVMGQTVNGAFVRNDTETRGCQCPDPSCYRCDQRAGEFGDICQRCRGGKFLLNGTCLDDCSTAPAGFIEYFPGSFGRECRPPFVCINNLDENGVACKCHASANILGRRCRHCSYNVSGITCLETV